MTISLAPAHIDPVEKSISEWIARLPQQLQDILNPAWQWANAQPALATIAGLAIVALVLFLITRILKILVVGAVVIAIVGAIAVFIVGPDKARAYLQQVYAAEPDSQADRAKAAEAKAPRSR